MIEVQAPCGVGPAAIWDVVADPWTFPAWVVGAARVDRADATWPAVGSGIEYRAGFWPMLLPARTAVLDSTPGRELVLHGDLGRIGQVELVLRMQAADAGSQLSIREDISSGLGAALPTVVRAAAIKLRNVETLRRLALLAERALEDRDHP